DRERNPDAFDLLVASQIHLGDPLGPSDARDRFDSNLEEVIRIEKEKLRVAVLQSHPQLVGESAVHVFGAEVLDPVALLAPVNERALDLSRLRQNLGVVRGGLLRVALPEKGLEVPSLVAVIGVDRRQSLKSELGSDLSGPLLEDSPSRFDLGI